jgi:hypothetical protein
LASARAIAAKEQRYAGIRFQKRYDPNNPDPLNESQYIIFIVQDPNMGHAYGFGFHAVEGIQPIKLPDSIGVMDLTIVTQRNKQYPDSPTQQIPIDNPVLGGDSHINEVFELLDTTTFSIIFSPSGKLVIHGVWVRNKNGISDYPSYPEQSYDDIFNKKSRVDAGLAMFYQDDYWGDNAYLDIGLGPEPSRNSFVIYDTKKLKQVDQNLRWTNYLSQLKRIYINPYTGTIINEK